MPLIGGDPRHHRSLYGGFEVQCVKPSKDKVDRVILHPSLPWVGYVDRTGAVVVWDYSSEEEIYVNQLGGSDDGALQEASLRQSAAISAAAIGGPLPPKLSPGKEASLSAKSTASGAVNDIAFLDIDTVFWQLAGHSSLQYDSFDSSSIPEFGPIKEIDGHRWIVAACENKVILHDIISTDSFDISRSASFESKAPTRVAFLIMNNPSLVLGSDHLHSGGKITGYVLPSLVVGTSAGCIYVVSPTSGTVFAKLSGGHRSSITSLQVIGSEDGPAGPERLVSASADGTIAIWDPSKSPMHGSDREISPIKILKGHDAAIRDVTYFCSYPYIREKRSGNPMSAVVGGIMNAAAGGANAISNRTGLSSLFFKGSNSSKKNEPKAPEVDESQKKDGDNASVEASQPKGKSDAKASMKTKLFLATVGDDKHIVIWDVSSWTPTMRTQPFQSKISSHTVQFAPWGSAGIGEQPSILLASGDSTQVLGLDPATGVSTTLIDIQGLVDSGHKKSPKIYHMMTHPIRPHLTALATNTGVVLITADPSEHPPVVALPAQVLTLEALMAQSASQEDVEHNKPTEDGQEHSSKQKGIKEPTTRSAAGLTYVVASHGKLWSTAYRLESRISSKTGSRDIALESNSSEILVELNCTGRPSISCSATGRSISAVWKDQGSYAVYSLSPTGSWEVVDQGSGISLAWASTAPMYAVISASSGYVSNTEAQKKAGLFGGAFGFGKTADSKQSSKENNPETLEGGTVGKIDQAGNSSGTDVTEKPSNAEAGSAIQSTGPVLTVQIHVVDERSSAHVVAANEINLNGAKPLLLHGGALLGLVAMDPMQKERSLRFFSWRDFSPVGPPLVEPHWVSWEPECTLVALGYAQTIELCRIHPTFQRFATLALPGTQSALWQSRQLFVSNYDACHVIFADPVQEYVEEICLASTLGRASTKRIGSLESTSFPLEDMRPAGPIVLAGVRHSYLWLADTFGKPFLISLRHPGLRVRCLAARGELTTARMIAERGLNASFHDSVAQFLAAMSPGDGVKEALLLSGITPETELILSIKCGEWNRAAIAFQAFALRVADKRLLELTLADDHSTESLTWYQKESNDLGILASSYRIRADKIEEVDSILKEHGKAQNIDGDACSGKEMNEIVSESDVDVSNADEPNTIEGVCIDWEAPLQKENSKSNSDASKSSFAAVSASALDIFEPAEYNRICNTAELGVRLADLAISNGNEGAARAVLGVLTRFAPLLPPNLLRDLVMRMGQCRMTESCRNLSIAAATFARPGSGLRDASVAALLAALSGGSQVQIVNQSLDATGLYPLSAIFDVAWRHKDVDSAAIQWKRALGKNMDIIAPQK